MYLESENSYDMVYNAEKNHHYYKSWKGTIFVEINCLTGLFINPFIWDYWISGPKRIFSNSMTC